MQYFRHKSQKKIIVVYTVHTGLHVELMQPTSKKFVASSGIRARIFGFLDRRSTHWAIELTGIGSPPPRPQPPPPAPNYTQFIELH